MKNQARRQGMQVVSNGTRKQQQKRQDASEVKKERSLTKQEIIEKELLDAKKKYEELNGIYQAAINEQETLKAPVKESINKLCEENNMFCGVILTKQDVLGIIDLLFKTNDQTVEIPYHLYIKKQ